MQLSNWNPFRFKRKQKADKADSASVPVVVSPPAPLAPLTPMDAMQRLMGQMMAEPFFPQSSLLRDAFAPTMDQNRWFGDFSPAVFQPNIDVIDEGKVLRVSVELPGLDQEGVSVQVDHGALTIEGEKRTEATSDEEGCYRTERAYGHFRRVVPLPADVQQQGAEATFDKGVLTVRIPKAEETQSTAKRIPIRSA